MVVESGDGVPYATALRLVTNEEQIWDETSIAGKKAGEEGASLPPSAQCSAILLRNSKNPADIQLCALGQLF